MTKFKILSLPVRILIVFTLGFLNLLFMAAIAVWILSYYYPEDYAAYIASLSPKTAASSTTITVGAAAYNKYTSMINALDLSKLNADYSVTNKSYKSADKGLTGRDWNTMYSPYSDMSLYMLAAEICSRSEINPTGAAIQVTPMDLLGDIVPESGGSLGNEGALPFETWLVRNSALSDDPYLPNGVTCYGFYQYMTAYFLTGTDDQSNGFMYISSFENPLLDNSKRAIYGSQARLAAGKGIVGLDLKPNCLSSIASSQYVSQAVLTDSADNYAASWIKYFNDSDTKSGEFNRPSSNFLSDGMYTLAANLRTAFQGADIYTFASSKDSYNDASIQAFNAWASKCVGLSQDEKNKLAYADFLLYHYERTPQNVPNSDTATAELGGSINRLHFALQLSGSSVDAWANSNALLTQLDISEDIRQFFTGFDYDDAFFTKNSSYGTSLLQKAMTNSSVKSVTGDLESAIFNNGALEGSDIAESRKNITYGLFACNIGARMQSSLEREIEYFYNLDGGKYRKAGAEGVAGSTSSKLLFPIQGMSTYISCPYGYEAYSSADGKSRFHTGMDIAGAGIEGNPVEAAMDGTITWLSTSDAAYGNCITITNTDTTSAYRGYYTFYGHMKRLSTGISVGSVVKRGTIIGYVGNTGNVSGANGGYHLHFEVGAGVTKDFGTLDPEVYYYDNDSSVTWSSSRKITNAM